MSFLLLGTYVHIFPIAVLVVLFPVLAFLLFKWKEPDENIRKRALFKELEEEDKAQQARTSQ